MDKLIITGHTGFVGSHLVDKLSSKYEVIGISCKPSHKTKIASIKKDIRKIKPNDIPKNVSCIIHTAALTDLEYCNNNPRECYEINVMGTGNILEIARKIDSKFVLLSTNHVYGIPQKLPINEDHQTKPNSIYASSKLASEILVESYFKSYGMNCAVLRFFSLYGPKSPSHLVTTKIISQMLTKNSIELGNLHTRRDFLYVDDAVNAIELVIKKARRFNVYNVGSGKSYSILEICNLLSKIAGKNVPIKSIKSRSRKSDVDEIISDSSRIQKIGWTPQFKIEKGLKRTFDWFSTNIDNILR